MLKDETVEESIVLLDFTPELPCESRFHAVDAEHEGGAEFFQRGPCAATTGYRCGKVVQAILSALTQAGDWSEVCPNCNARHWTSELSHSPLSAG